MNLAACERGTCSQLDTAEFVDEMLRLESVGLLRKLTQFGATLPTREALWEFMAITNKTAIGSGLC